MPGGKGGTDIYVVTINNGHYGAPKNLGPTVNSKYKEYSIVASFLDGPTYRLRQRYTLPYSIENSNTTCAQAKLNKSGRTATSPSVRLSEKCLGNPVTSIH